MTRFLPLVLLLTASLLAAEFPISEPDVLPFDRAVIDNGAPTVAAGDDGFLVLWDSLVPHGGLPSPGPTWVRAYDASGPRRPVASSVFGAAASSRAVWTGSEYLVASTPQFLQFGILVPAPMLVLSRFDADGGLITRNDPIELGTRAGHVIGLAWDGAHAAALVQFVGSPASSAFLLDREGRLVVETSVTGEPSDIAPRRGGGFFILQRSQGDAVAPGGISFAAIDNTDHGVVARILDGSGAELDRFVVSATGAVARSLAWTGREWITMFHDGAQLCTARFTRASDVRTECVLNPAAQGAFVAAGAAGVMRAWWQDGQVVTERGLASTRWSQAGIPAAVVDETGLLAAWVEDTAAGGRIHLGGRANDGTPRPEIVVPGEGLQSEPLLSRSGGQTLLVWVEGTRIRATRVDAQGQPVAPAVKLSGDFAAMPAIAAREGAWLVAWRTGDAIETRLVSAAMTLSEPERIVSPPVALTPAVAATRDGYLLVWTEVTDQASVLAQRLDTTGRAIGERVRVSPFGFTPAIACSDDVCLVTFFANGMLAQTVRHDGSVVGAPRSLGPLESNPPVILVLRDGSFQLHHGELIFYFDRDGRLRDALHWGDGLNFFGDAVIWNGKVTMVSMRSAHMGDGFFATRVTAFQFPPRLRSVRH